MKEQKKKLVPGKLYVISPDLMQQIKSSYSHMDQPVVWLRNVPVGASDILLCLEEDDQVYRFLLKDKFVCALKIVYTSDDFVLAKE